jgi:predicted RNA-binding Zn-ribbon protein involved in translation (DUF1610 family)
MQLPESMDEVLYFTNRKLEDGTRIIAFTRKKECPECQKALMGKPLDPKTKRPKVRSTTYECPECGYQEPKKAHEEEREVEIEYTNPEGTEKKHAKTPYTRKTWKGVPAFVFENEFTGEKMGVTKKMKAPKKK